MAINKEKSTHMRKKVLIDIPKLEILSSYTSDYKLRIHGRAISKQLKLSQKNISNHLKRMHEMGIINYEILGKNKNYYLNNTENIRLFLIQAEIFKALKIFNSNFEIQDITANIKEYLEGIILIFGSFSKGYAAKGSDLDILVIGKIKNKAKIEKIGARYNIKLHLINVSKKEFENGLRKKKAFMIEILKGHIIVEGFEEFVNIVWRFYNE